MTETLVARQSLSSNRKIQVITIIVVRNFFKNLCVYFIEHSFCKSFKSYRFKIQLILFCFRKPNDQDKGSMDVLNSKVVSASIVGAKKATFASPVVLVLPHLNVSNILAGLFSSLRDNCIWQSLQSYHFPYLSFIC